jgi:hypothetical protein
MLLAKIKSDTQSTTFSSSPFILAKDDTANFIYQLESVQLTQNRIDTINNIESASTIKDRLTALKDEGIELKFSALEQLVFSNNLVLIDSLLPNILAELVKVFYSTNLSRITALTDYLKKGNPMQYDRQHSNDFYEYKVKQFLTEVALGMLPSKVWNGKYNDIDSYAIIKKNGEVLNHLFDTRNTFEDYLYHNTKLETTSTSRHGFGKIYEENGAYYFKLNLQIRFS